MVMFGALPSADRVSEFVPEETMTLKTVIANVKSVRAGDSIGYGREYIAPKDMEIATVPIGYADGFLRSSYTNGIKLSVRGKACNVVGRICMDQCMIDVTGLPVKVGDEVTVFGSDPDELSSLASLADTIEYECICLVSARVPRVKK